MPNVSGNDLVMAIQAVEAEIRRLRDMSGDEMVLGDMVLLDAYETTADRLEEAYAEALETTLNLPPYAQLVGRNSEDGK
jgi:hypothetical protein